MPTSRYWALLGLCLVFAEPRAQDEQEVESSEELDAVSLEFLEFLGEWETSDGQWLDPNELDDEETDDSNASVDDDD